MTSSETYTLIHDCPATAIPAGENVTLPKGTEVFIAQTLGGNITVRTDRGLFRIAAGNVAAIGGYTSSDNVPPPSAPGEFSEQAVWEALKTCFDPEIPVNIVDLGLVYECELVRGESGEREVRVRMTLTAPGCGMGDILVDDVRTKLEMIPTVAEAEVELVFDPPWNQTMMSEAARLETGML